MPEELLEMSWVTSDVLPYGQSFGQIFKETFRQYRKNGWLLTRPLLLPWLKITAGGYACIILNYLFINTLTQGTLIVESFGWMILGILVITAITLYPFLTGFWEYVVYFASLNRNATEAFTGHSIQTKPAYETVVKNNASAYQILLAAYVLVPILIFIGFSLASWVLIAPQLTQGTVAIAASLLGVLFLQAVGVLCSLVVTVLFTFIFQFAAFEKLPLNPTAILWQSARMVMLRWPTVLGLQILLAFITTILVPLVVSLVFRLLWLSWPLDQVHLWMTGLILEGAAPVGDTASLFPGYGQMFQMFEGNNLSIAKSLTDTLLGGLVTSLLLPLGTLAFTRIYWDIRLQMQVGSYNGTLQKTE